MAKGPMNRYNEKLLSIQWVTSNQKFNKKQHIELGDAICAFNDCIEENKILRGALDELWKGHMSDDQCAIIHSALEGCEKEVDDKNQRPETTI